MELIKIINDKRGQMRVIEALIACIILLTGLSAAVSFSGLLTVAETSELEEVGINILHVLDNSGVVERIIKNQDNWESELKELLDTLLPTNTFYNLTIISSITGQLIIESTNIFDQDFYLGLDIVSLQYVTTVSFPSLDRGNQKLDVMLVIDRSGSMNEKEPGDEYSKLYYAKEATKAFVDQLNMSLDRVGVVSFSTEATIDVHLTNNSAEIKDTIDSLVASGYTNIGDGINKTSEEFLSNGRDDSIWALILLSDGRTNRPLPESYARDYAISESEKAAEIGIASYTIGLGADSSSFDEELLKQIATNGYYYAPSAEDLEDIYSAIAQDLLFEVSYDVIVLQLILARGE